MMLNTYIHTHRHAFFSPCFVVVYIYIYIHVYTCTLAMIIIIIIIIPVHCYWHEGENNRDFKNICTIKYI